MSTSPQITLQNPLRNRRPWWLLLALALFLAGQTLAAAHWHDDSQGLDSDSDCALCVYSSTATATVSAAGWQIPIFIAALICLNLAVSVQLPVVRFCDSRAPPVFQR